MAKASIRSRPLFEGAAYSVEAAIRPNGKDEVEEFLASELEKLKIKARPIPSTARTKMEALFSEMANRGHVGRKRFDREMNGFYAFKHEICGKLIRFPCFFDNRRLILTHGFFKPGAQQGKGAWPLREIDKATAIRKEYEDLRR